MNKYPKHKYIRASLPGLILCFGSFVYGAETFSSTSLLDSKSWTLSVYGRTSETTPVIKLSGSSGIVVPTSGGSTTVFSGTDADVEMEQSESNVMFALSAKPRDGLVYSLYAGQVQDFELEFSSGSQVNSLRSTSNGWRWGVGLSGTLAPISPVSVGVSWSLNYTQTDVQFDRFQGGPDVYAVDESLRQQEFQGALQATYRWKMLEPYAGLKIARLQTTLDDRVSKQRVRGTTDGLSPMLGLRWAMFEREFLQIEASFMDEKSLTAGLIVQF